MTPPPSIPAPSTTRRIAPRAFDVRTGQESDYPSITRLSEKVYGVRRSIESIRWLYDANPAGPCRLWLAVDRASNEVVALRPVFPWRARVSGQNVSVGRRAMR